MKCPLLMSAQLTHGGSATIPLTNCLKEECAWWIPQTEYCAIHILTDLVGNLVVDLKAIKDKMPHEEQFRR